ncbi:ubiE/COQ5 methyltransferase, putative [Plasmodium malariae]|uniref:2-methoxy-6-polyprenyl-1,4-benzoquinol methylase, mitochondrial n=1 Tax=Plasmodium malariae TaxID=5858 RepID=A0A1C3KAS9_PLAMA|nr:ubiE/COQ5 methyltransferase, putative [Plasmodium malariae]
MKAKKLCDYHNYNHFSKKNNLVSFLRRELKSYSTKGDHFSSNEKLYNFGFQKVTEEIKSKLVHNLFSKVSNKYDLMNDLMSLRLHHCWKNELVKELDLFLKYHSYNMEEEMYIRKRDTINEDKNIEMGNFHKMWNEEQYSEDPHIREREKYEHGQEKYEQDREKYEQVREKYEQDREKYERDKEKYERDKEKYEKGMEKSSASQDGGKMHSCKILDLAGGTGDIAFRILEKYKYHLKKRKSSNNSYNEYLSDEMCINYMPNIIVCDINSDMIKVGIEKAKNLNYDKYITWLIENAENLKSFEDNSVDIITLSFGIRNFTNIPKALKEVHRVLKPGGRFLCLEFSKVNCDVINIFYKFYLNNFIPLLGKLVANSEHSYKYLAESIQTFLTPDELSQLMHQCNFRSISYTTLSLGIVAIHSAYKLII